MILSGVAHQAFAQNQTLYLNSEGQATIDPSTFNFDCFEEDDTSIPSAAEGDGHALGSSNNTFTNSSTDFIFEQGVKFKEFPEGTASTFNTNNSSDQWQVVVYLVNNNNTGISYKDEKNLAGNAYQDWTYYELSSESVLIGLGENSGEEMKVSHMPEDFTYGFQLGEAANSKNANYGLSGWFWYKKDGKWKQGDINIDLNNCSGGGNPGEPGGCILNVLEWEGNVTVCVNGVSRCVSQTEAAQLLAQGASLGSCNIVTSDINQTGNQAFTDIEQESDPVSDIVEVNAYPNPTKGITQIEFKVNEAGTVKVAVYSSQGIMIEQLYEGTAEANRSYRFEFNAADRLDGIYQIRVNIQGFMKTKKLIIAR